MYIQKMEGFDRELVKLWWFEDVGLKNRYGFWGDWKWGAQSYAAPQVAGLVAYLRALPS